MHMYSHYKKQLQILTRGDSKCLLLLFGCVVRDPHSDITGDRFMRLATHPCKVLFGLEVCVLSLDCTTLIQYSPQASKLDWPSQHRTVCTRITFLADAFTMLLRQARMWQTSWSRSRYHYFVQPTKDQESKMQVVKKTNRDLRLFPASRRLLLKCSLHLMSLPALLETFPGAQLVFTVRPVSELLPSYCSHIQHLHTHYGQYLLLQPHPAPPHSLWSVPPTAVTSSTSTLTMVSTSYCSHIQHLKQRKRSQF